LEKLGEKEPETNWLGENWGVGIKGKTGWKAEGHRPELSESGTAGVNENDRGHLRGVLREEKKRTRKKKRWKKTVPNVATLGAEKPQERKGKYLGYV